MNDSTTTLCGNAATDVRSGTTERGVAYASFRVGSSPRRFDAGSGTWVDGPATFVGVTCWRSLAENVAESVRRGDPVLVTGRLRVRSYTPSDGGPAREVAEIEATAVGHDLGRGTASFQRRRRPSEPGDDAGASHTAEPSQPSEAAEPSGAEPGEAAPVG